MFDDYYLQSCLCIVYYNVRALCAKFPFPSRQNLIEAYNLNRDLQQRHAAEPKASRWIREMIKAHECLFNNIELDSVFDVVAPTIRNTLTNSKVISVCIIRIVVVLGWTSCCC